MVCLQNWVPDRVITHVMMLDFRFWSLHVWCAFMIPTYSNTSKVTVLMESCFSQLCGVILSHVQQLVGGLEHFLFSPIVGMMIQSDFHIFQRGWSHHVRQLLWWWSPINHVRLLGSWNHRHFLGCRLGLVWTFCAPNWVTQYMWRFLNMQDPQNHRCYH